MDLENLRNTISELSADDAATILVDALCAVGEHGREAGEAIPDKVAALSADEKIQFEEGLGWLEDQD